MLNNSERSYPLVGIIGIFYGEMVNSSFP